MIQLEDLKAHWTTDSIINDERLDVESIKTANLHQKYLDFLTDFKLKIFKLEKEYLHMKGVRSKYYQGQMTKQELEACGWAQYPYSKPLKSELERLLSTDKYLLDIRDTESYYRFCFEYCEEVLKALRDRNWQIRTAVDWKKFMAGV